MAGSFGDYGENQLLDLYFGSGTPATGNISAHADLDASRAVTSGITVSFAIGELDITLT